MLARVQRVEIEMLSTPSTTASAIDHELVDLVFQRRGPLARRAEPLKRIFERDTPKTRSAEGD